MVNLSSEGISFIDDRGKLVAFNDFSLEKIKRMYQIEHSDTSIIRAWQGHRVESKWFYVISGSFTIGYVKIDDFITPSEKLIANYKNISVNDNKVLHIPAGYANGLKAIEPQSKLIIFSDLSLEEAKEDNYKFDSNLWLDWDDLKSI
ncbi:hypothetical protein MM236_10060 [Belliella sp. DSM 107340]|uniref:dTDP-4-dehydrorhamnose 3,5-epimerase-like enzyme n=1 Tax=Belliella calami TaxID=2923436 RepID=A0ABS9UQ77_9BACT|nr:hypothetical protein [Belliella calami]MCH7398335.1 hypothetical protein [Belliella calami]